MGAALINLSCLSDELVMKGKLLSSEPMAAHTSWRVGGPADNYYVPVDLEDLSMFLAELCVDEQIFWLGLGSNILVRDGGIRGTVIAAKGVLNEMVMKALGMKVGAGLTCAKAARFSARNGKSGAEFLAGIPGTIGGALTMNAGAFGSEMWNIVSSVETINRKGELRVRSAADFETRYRFVNIANDEWFISANLILADEDIGEARFNIRELLAQRAASQPIGELSCGSVFRNPEGDFAARLIESCGLKGMSIGAAKVSEKHANFIINSGSANAADIEELILHIKKVVLEQCQVDLQTEVRIVGEAL